MNNDAIRQFVRKELRAVTLGVATAIGIGGGLPAAIAGPIGGTVVSGRGSITSPNATTTLIDQQSISLTLNWSSFNIASGETVRFVQPSSSSVALNNILSQSPSQIFGQLEANGRVVLINPNGILFGRGAQLNVGSLIASSLELKEYDPATGQLSFQSLSGHPGVIDNEGTINAAPGGSVALLGGTVLNNGLVVADYGTVAMGAGEVATLDFYGGGLLRVQVGGDLKTNPSGASAAVQNGGRIEANGGQVLLTASATQDVFAAAVDNSGVIRAARIKNVGGVIELLGTDGSASNSGTLDASGAGPTSTGGTVTVTGSSVSLSSTARVDVSGAAGGGSAYIGGGLHGADSSIPDASSTSVASGATIDADATHTGNGGTIAVWSDGTTTAQGNFSANGGPAGGNGGLIETSGHILDVTGAIVRAAAPAGKAGQWLLDPTDVEIEHGSGSSIDGSGSNEAASPVYDSDINTALASGTNVTVETSTSPPTGSTSVGAITFGSGVVITNGGTGATTLTLDADTSIDLTNATAPSITSGTGALNLVLTANANGQASPSSLGSVTLDGTINVNTLTVNGTAAITQAGGSITVAGTTSLNAGSGNDITLNSTTNAFNGNVTFSGDNVTVANSAGTTIAGASAAGSLTLDAGGAVTFGTASTDSTTVTNGLVIQGLSGSGAVGGAVGQVGTLSVGTASDIDAGGNAITLGNSGNSLGGNVTFTGAAVILASAGALSSSGTASGNLSEAAAGTISEGAAGIQLTGTAGANTATFTVTGATHDVDLGNAANDFNDDTTTITASGGGAVGNVSVADTYTTFVPLALPETLTSLVLSDANAPIALGAETLTGVGGGTNLAGGTTTLDVTAGGVITQTGTVSVTGTTGLSANSGASDITLGQENTFSGNVAFSGHNVTLTTGTGGLSSSGTAGGNLSETAAGTISEGTAGIQLTGTAGANTATFTVTGATHDVDLGNAANDFNDDATTIATSGGGAVGNVSVADTYTTFVPLTLPETLTSLVLSDANAPIALGAETLTGVGGGTNLAGGTTTLDVTAGGVITQTGAVSVTGTTGLSANSGASDITLGQENTFSGNVAFSGHNVTLTTGTGGLSSSGTAGGNLSETAAGTISEGTAGIQLTGTAGANTVTFTVTGATHDVDLGNAANDFNDDATTIATSGGGTVGSVSVADTYTTFVPLTLPETLTSLVLSDPNAPIALGAETLTGVGGGTNLAGGTTTLDVTAGGVITQTGAVSVTGTTGLSANSGASDITLGQENTFSGNVAFSGDNVTLTTGTGGLSSSGTAGGTLTETSAGAITQGGVLSVTGTTTLTADGGAGDISLGQGNTFGGNVAFSGDNVTLTTGTGGLSSSGTAAGTLTEMSAGAITQGGVLSVAGTSTLTTSGGAGDITLGQGNTFGGNVAFSGHNVTLTTGTGDLSSSGTAGGTLTETSADAITQGGALSVTGTSTLTANGGAGDISLGQANTFGGNVAFSGDNVTLTTGTGGLSSSGTAEGTLTETSAGAITQSAALSVTGTSTLTANGGAGDISLGQANTFGGNLGFSGDNVTLTTGTGGLSSSGTAEGTLTETSAGAITQSAALSVTGTSTLTANGGAGDISLGQGNTFGGNVAFSGDNVTLTSGTGGLSSSGTAAGNLIETAAGTISEGATGIQLTGTAGANTATFTVTGATHDVGLGNAANDFNDDTTTITASGGGAVGNVSVADTNATFVPLVFPGTLTSLVLSDPNAPIALAAETLTGVGGGTNLAGTTTTLDVTAGGAITQNGAVSVSGATALSANGGTSDITLGEGNTFGGNVAFNGHNVTLTTGTGGLSSSGTAGGTLTETSAGAIAQGGVLSVAGTTMLTADGGAGDISLGQANTFGGNVAFSGYNVTLTTGTGGLSSSGTAGGTLAETSAGAITQGGVLNVAGTATLTANGGAGDISLGQENTFSGNVAFSGHNVTLTTGTGGLSSSGTAGGNLSETAAGTISEGTAGIQLTGTAGANTATFTVTGATHDVDLGNAANDFNDDATTIATSGGGTVGSVSVADTYTTFVPLTLPETLTSLVLSDPNAPIALGAETLTGVGGGTNLAGGTTTLDVTAGGVITQTGAVSVTGTTGLSANSGASDITLGQENTFSGNVAFSGDNVTLTTGTGGLSSSGTAGGTLTETSAGAITQGGVLSVTGTTTLTADGGAGDISLGQGNTFGGNVAFSGDNVTLTTGTGGLSSSGTAAGTLTEMSAGAITQGAVLSVAGTSTLTANGGGGDITLGQGNTFGGNVAFSGHNVTLTTGTGDLSSSGTAGGTLTETSADAITQGGALSVTGTSTLTANGGMGDITLANAANAFVGPVTLSGGAVTLANADPTTLDGTDRAGSLTLDAGAGVTFGTASADSTTVTNGLIVQGLSGSGAAGGTVSEVGTLSVGTTTSIDAGANDITLNQMNTFGGDVTFTGRDVTLIVGTGSLTSSGTASGALTEVAEGPSADVNVGVLSAGGDVLLVAGNSILGTSSQATVTANNVEVRYGLENSNAQLGSANADQQIGFEAAPGSSRVQLTVWLPAPGTQFESQDLRQTSSDLQITRHPFAAGEQDILYLSPFGVSPAQVAGTLAAIQSTLQGTTTQSAGVAQGAATQGTQSVLYIDWGSYNPNVSLFGTLNPAVCLPADQRDESVGSGPGCAAASASVLRTPTPILVAMVPTREGWKPMQLFYLAQ